MSLRQVNECMKYGISTISINEDTPNDTSLWQVKLTHILLLVSMYGGHLNSFTINIQSIRAGKYEHLIVSPEQLSMFNGHLPRLARLIHQDGAFVKRIKRVHIDEAHNIYTAGLAHHGEEAFRPSYGKLGQFRVLLNKDTTFQALSATLPPHILTAVKCELLIRSNHLSLTLSTNRPNITYAVTPLIGGLRNFRNFDCLIPSNYMTPMIIPKTLIFHDNKQEAVDAAAYNDSRLPKALQNRGVVKYYHSDMSAEYLQQTYEDFASDSGSCRILHATAGASTVRTCSTNLLNQDV
jgi:superfamily II DNA helicase RecQ